MNPFVIHKSHSKSELIKIIKSFKINIDNPSKHKKIDLSALLVNELCKMEIIIPSNDFWFFNIIDLKVFLIGENPEKILSVKQKKMIISKCRNIIHFTRNDLCPKENGYYSLKGVHKDALIVSKFGDIPSCRRAIRLYNGTPEIIDFVNISISYHMRNELAKREVLKHNKLYKYKKLTGDFEVVFD
jgi:hypothetical protein